MLVRLPVMTFAEARAAHEILKAQERLIKLEKIARGMIGQAKPRTPDETP